MVGDIKKYVRKIICDCALISETDLKDDATLGFDHGVDSLDQVEILCRLEDKFKVALTFEAEDMNRMTVNSITEEIEKMLRNDNTNRE